MTEPTANLDFLMPRGEGRDVHTEAIDRARYLYVGLVKTYNGICTSLRDQESVDCSPALRFVEEFVTYVQHDERMLMGLAQAPLPYIEREAAPIEHPEVVFYGINTMIYSLQISANLPFTKEQMSYLGLAALFQNIGLIDFPEQNLALKSAEEIRDRISQGGERGAAYLKKLEIEAIHRDSLETIINIILSRESVLEQTSLHTILHQFAMIIHICNVFVYLTHGRDTDGRSVAPCDAMKIMRSTMKDFFNPDAVKLFFNKLSIYPIGTFVRLSSSETAKIVAISENFVMRPTVLVVLDSDRKEKIPKQRIDLREKPNVYIKSSIVDDELTERFIDLF